MVKSKYFFLLLPALFILSLPSPAQQSVKKTPAKKTTSTPAKKPVKPVSKTSKNTSVKPKTVSKKSGAVPVRSTAVKKGSSAAKSAAKPKSAAASKAKTASVKKKAPPSPFEKQKGKLPVPASGAKVVRSFGKCPHPTLSGVYIDNLGIDFRTKSLASVCSVFPGVITEVFSVPGVGGTVIVKHGEYYTVYSGIDAGLAEKNKKINKGHVLGKTYKTNSGKSDFSFQIWHGRRKLNPKEWILPSN